VRWTEPAAERPRSSSITSISDQMSPGLSSSLDDRGAQTRSNEN
jgi:hypothetical protein